MKNADMPAMPANATQQEYYDATGDSSVKGYAESQLGLTKREMFAMHAMQALATNHGYGTWQDMANDAVNIADALLAELESTK